MLNARVGFWPCFYDWGCWNVCTNTTEPVKHTKKGRCCVSSLPLSLFHWYAQQIKYCIPHRFAGLQLFLSSEHCLNHMVWDKAQQTHKATHSDKADVTWSVSNCCFLDLEKRKAETFLFLCVLCVWGFLFLRLTVTFKQGHKQKKSFWVSLPSALLRATRQNRVTSAELSSLTGVNSTKKCQNSDIRSGEGCTLSEYNLLWSLSAQKVWLHSISNGCYERKKHVTGSKGKISTNERMWQRRR